MEPILSVLSRFGGYPLITLSLVLFRPVKSVQTPHPKPDSSALELWRKRLIGSMCRWRFELFRQREFLLGCCHAGYLCVRVELVTLCGGTAACSRKIDFTVFCVCVCTEWFWHWFLNLLVHCEAGPNILKFKFSSAIPKMSAFVSWSTAVICWCLWLWQLTGSPWMFRNMYRNTSSGLGRVIVSPHVACLLCVDLYMFLIWVFLKLYRQRIVDTSLDLVPKQSTILWSDRGDDDSSSSSVVPSWEE
jgi:hypothetical protein